jgi:hypothetical protein
MAQRTILQIGVYSETTSGLEHKFRVMSGTINVMTVQSPNILQQQ